MIYIFRHLDCEGPGYLLELLDELQLKHALVAIDQGDAVPSSIEGMHGLVFIGGPMSVNDNLPWISLELDLIRAAQARGVPVLGHCLGAQLMAKAMGAPVALNPVREIGWHHVVQTSHPLAQEWMAGIDKVMMAFHWHGETFALPDGATRILGNEHCHNQGFVMGSSLGLQCHVEMTRPMLEEWVARFNDQLTGRGAVQAPAQILQGIDLYLAQLQRNARTLYLRWLQPILNP